MRHNDWTQVAIICGASGSGTTYYSCAATQHLLQENGIKVSNEQSKNMKVLKINQWATMNASMSTSDVDAILETTKTSARIIIAPMDAACDGAELVLIQRATALGMLNGILISHNLISN